MLPLVYVVEDEPGTCQLYEFWLENLDLRARVFHSAAGVVASVRRDEPVAVCLDLNLPDHSGLDLLHALKQQHPHLPVIVMTGDDDARSGVAAIKAGAHDYLVKPIAPEAFDAAVLTARQRHGLEVEVRALRSQLHDRHRVQGLLGQSPAMLELGSQIGTVLDSDVPVLLQGETGTGKELVARTIHANSARARGPCVPVNCGAIPAELQESHFFGHERGAFTGAERTRRGFFEEADTGVVFLDEIGELTLDAQVTLLRVLESGVVRRVGGDREIPVDVRVISATHRDLRAMVAAGEFREDLFFRLVVYPIALPALRARTGDIPLLVGHFLRHYARRMGLAVPEVTGEALQHLARYRWPGNVRELQNAVQFALLASRGAAVGPEHLPPAILDGAGPDGPRDDPDVVTLRDPATGDVRPFAAIEQDVLRKVRDLEGGNMTRTARALQIGRATLYRKLHPA